MTREPSSRAGPSRGPMAGVLHRNIEALAEVRQEFERRKSRQDRMADAITRFTGSLTFVYVHAALFGSWLLINLRLVPGVPAWDPFPFVMLAMIASVEAIFLSTFVLISQNRMAALSSQRDELDVQISLLAEHEITRIIGMVEALLHHHGVPLPAAAEEIAELKRDVSPRPVVAEIERINKARS